MKRKMQCTAPWELLECCSANQNRKTKKFIWKHIQYDGWERFSILWRFLHF